MKTFKQFIKEASNYPPGAEFDPRAPWNEPDYEEDFIVELDDGEIKILTTYDGVVDNDNIQWLDPYYVDKLLADKSDISFDEIEESGEGFEIKDIEGLGKDEYKLITSRGDFIVSLDELQNLK